MDIDDENATLASMINNQTLVPPENVRDPGSQLYCRILYVFRMTPKLMSILRRMRNFTEEQTDDHINWFNDTFDGTVTRVKEIAYTKTTFGPRMSGLYKHTKLMEVESVAFNENKLIQEWVDKEIKYPYTLQDLGNREYRQTIAQTGFTENIVAELTKIGFTTTQLDKNIKQIRNRFGFDVRKTGSRRGKHVPPFRMPEIVFVQEKGGTVPTTSGGTVPTSSSATPAKPFTSESTPTTGASTEITDTIEQTIGMVTITDPGGAVEEGEQLPMISTVFSMSTAEGIEDPETEQAVRLEYVSTLT